MSERPEDGVVDALRPRARRAEPVRLRRSAFTTGAAANPTLTIVALAIRQAEHIASSLKAQEL